MLVFKGLGIHWALCSLYNIGTHTSKKLLRSGRLVKNLRFSEGCNDSGDHLQFTLTPDNLKSIFFKLRNTLLFLFYFSPDYQQTYV